MRLTIPWLWLSIGELTYLLVAPVSVLQSSWEKAQRKADHPRAVMVVGLMFCVMCWPIFAAFLLFGIFSAIVTGFRSAK